MNKPRHPKRVARFSLSDAAPDGLGGFDHKIKLATLIIEGEGIALFG